MTRTVTYTPRLQWTGNTGTGTSGYNDYSRDYLVRIDGKPDLHAATLTIAAGSGDRLLVSGESTWVGDSETGNVHVGSVDAMAAIEGNQARYDADGCRFTIEFLHDALIVSGDDGGCGGMHVTFDGEYARVRP